MRRSVKALYISSAPGKIQDVQFPMDYDEKEAFFKAPCETKNLMNLVSENFYVHISCYFKERPVATDRPNTIWPAVRGPIVLQISVEVEDEEHDMDTIYIDYDQVMTRENLLDTLKAYAQYSACQIPPKMSSHEEFMDFFKQIEAHPDIKRWQRVDWMDVNAVKARAVACANASR